MSSPGGYEPQKKVSPTASILGAISALAVVMGMVYLGIRLETIDDRLSFRPPQSSVGQSESVPPASKGRAVYVPAYSHIYSRGGQAFLLEVTLSIRNTDPALPIRVDRVRYFDSGGSELRDLAETPVTLAPLGTASYLVEKRDTAGGSGAGFVVEWSADEAVNPPIVESVMIGVDTTHNLSFTSRGQPIAKALP